MTAVCMVFCTPKLWIASWVSDIETSVGSLRWSAYGHLESLHLIIANGTQHKLLLEDLAKSI